MGQPVATMIPIGIWNIDVYNKLCTIACIAWLLDTFSEHLEKSSMKQCMKQSPICSSNSMGSSEIWDKYHGSCIEISIFNASRVVLSQISQLFPSDLGIAVKFGINTTQLIPYPSYVVSSMFRVVLLQDSQLLKLPKNLLCTKHTSTLCNCCTKFHSYRIYPP